MSSDKARRIRIYVNEREVLALLEWLRKEGAAGATAFRAIAGIGAHVNVDFSPDLGPHAPAIVEWIDAADRVERLLPELTARLEHGLVTSEEVDVVFHKPHGMRALPKALAVEQVMSRDVVTARPETPLREVVALVEGKLHRAVPVVEASGKLVGIVTNLDLVERGGLLARVELLGSLGEAERAAALQSLGEKTARDVMTPDPATVAPGTPLTAAAEMMARRHLKRLPVVDASGKLAGIVSRLDVLRALMGTVTPTPGGPTPVGVTVPNLPLARVMRRDVPAVHPETPLAEVLQAIVATRLNRVLVVDADRRVVGIVTDEELLEKLTPPVRQSALRSLMHRLPFSHPERATAAEVMVKEVAIAREDQLLTDAIAPMMKAPHKLVAVVDAQGRLAGALDRADILRGLVQR